MRVLTTSEFNYMRTINTLFSLGLWIVLVFVGIESYDRLITADRFSTKELYFAVDVIVIVVLYINNWNILYCGMYPESNGDLAMILYGTLINGSALISAIMYVVNGLDSIVFLHFTGVARYIFFSYIAVVFVPLLALSLIVANLLLYDDEYVQHYFEISISITAIFGVFHYLGCAMSIDKFFFNDDIYGHTDDNYSWKVGEICFNTIWTIASFFILLLGENVAIQRMDGEEYIFKKISQWNLINQSHYPRRTFDGIVFISEKFWCCIGIGLPNMITAILYVYEVPQFTSLFKLSIDVKASFFINCTLNFVCYYAIILGLYLIGASIAVIINGIDELCGCYMRTKKESKTFIEQKRQDELSKVCIMCQAISKTSLDKCGACSSYVCNKCKGNQSVSDPSCPRCQVIRANLLRENSCSDVALIIEGYIGSTNSEVN